MLCHLVEYGSLDAVVSRHTLPQIPPERRPNKVDPFFPELSKIRAGYSVNIPRFTLSESSGPNSWGKIWKNWRSARLSIIEICERFMAVKPIIREKKLLVVLGCVLWTTFSICIRGACPAFGQELPHAEGALELKSPAEAMTVQKEKPKNNTWWRWLLFPFRPVGAETARGPCKKACANNFFAIKAPELENKAPNLEEAMTLVQIRSDWKGWGAPFAHHWLEMETSKGKLTIGFGPATIPFMDTGQIGIRDEYGNEQRISGKHPISVLTLPTRNRKYAKEIGTGHKINQPFPVSLRKADEVIESESRKDNVFLYIPLFNDCRTYVCTLKAKLQGKSTIWCHLLFKGYW
jgi:hypothetical protein